MNYSVYNNTFPIGQFYAGTSQSVPAYRPIRPVSDKVSVNRELDRILDKRVIADMVNTNPVLLSMLKSNNLKPVANVENFKKTTYNHSVDTRNHAIGIYNSLPAELKSEANPAHIQKAAILHDIGKVFIPERILNKRGKLTPEETDIMHLHSKLSAALLSTQNIEPEVLNIIKYHHQNEHGTGYPVISNTLNGFDLNTEIVAVADKYSALTEKRSYKPSMDSTDALKILQEEVNIGNINPAVFNALVSHLGGMQSSVSSDNAVAA